MRERGVIGARREHDVEFATLFTDREDQSRAFALSLEAHRRRIDDQVGDEFPPQGRNVLVFHGHGGIGKSALSLRMERWVTGDEECRERWGEPPATVVGATARIDLHGSQGFLDGAALLAQLRIQIGHLKERWPLFDAAFAAYWASTHPGDPLPAAENESGNRFAHAVVETLGALAEDHLFSDGKVTVAEVESSATLAAVSVRLLTRLADAIGDRVRGRLGVAVPEGYDELYMRCLTEPSREDPRPDLLGELARLLAFEIDAVAGGTPLVVVFVDTFERLDADARRTGEQLLNRVAWEMDNALFVVTGRNRLTWWELSGTPLAHRGPAVWPLLIHGAEGEPKQHALPYLSDRDRRILIARAIDQFGLTVTDDVREAIAEQSGGLPEYIRLAAHAAFVSHRNGMEVTVERATGSLQSLVVRLLEDVPTEDARAATLAAAIFPRPSIPLIAATAGVGHGAAALAVSRALFDSSNGEDGVHVMHDRVREAIRSAPATSQGGWTPEDWTAAGARALAYLESELRVERERYLAASRAGDSVATASAAESILRITGLAVTVIGEVDVAPGASASVGYEDWVSEALVKGPSVSGLQAHIPAKAKYRRGSDAVSFVQAKSLATPLEKRIDSLRTLYVEGGPLSWVAGRHLAYALNNAARHDEGLSQFDAMLASRPDNAFIRYQRSLTLARARRYRQVIESLPSLSESGQAGQRARVRFAHGLPDDFEDWLGDVVARGPKSGALKDGLENTGIAARWSGLTGRPVTVDSLAHLRTTAMAVGHDAAIRDAILAHFLVTGAISRTDARWLEDVDRSRNEGEMGFRTVTLRAGLAYLHDNRDALDELASFVARHRDRRGSLWIPIEFLFVSEGYDVEDLPRAEWLEPREIVTERWAAMWRSWKATHRWGPSD